MTPPDLTAPELLEEPVKMTEAQFSMQCSFVAKNAAAWAGDILTLPENYNRVANPSTVARFTDEMRKRLDLIDEFAGRPVVADHSRLREEVERLRAALEMISMMHDGNPPMPLADMPELDYARRTLGNMRYEARQALKENSDG